MDFEKSGRSAAKTAHCACQRPESDELNAVQRQRRRRLCICEEPREIRILNEPNSRHGHCNRLKHHGRHEVDGFDDGCERRRLLSLGRRTTCLHRTAPGAGHRLAFSLHLAGSRDGQQRLRSHCQNSQQQDRQSSSMLPATD